MTAIRFECATSDVAQRLRTLHLLPQCVERAAPHTFVADYDTLRAGMGDAEFLSVLGDGTSSAGAGATPYDAHYRLQYVCQALHRLDAQGGNFGFRYAMPTEVEGREGLPARPAPYSRVSACASTLNAKGPARVTVSAAVGAR